MALPLTNYWDLGRKAAEARNSDDESTATDLSSQFRSEQTKEVETRRKAANDAYHRGFYQHRKI